MLEHPETSLQSFRQFLSPGPQERSQKLFQDCYVLRNYVILHVVYSCYYNYPFDILILPALSTIISCTCTVASVEDTHHMFDWGSLDSLFCRVTHIGISRPILPRC